MLSTLITPRHTSALAAVALSCALITSGATPVAAAGTGAGTAVAAVAAPTAESRCAADPGAHCPTNAKQSRRAFRAGEWGHSEAPRRQWPTRLKRLVKRTAIKKGYVRRAGARPTESRARVSQTWGDFFGGLVDAIDCIAPGAESSCRRDLDDVRGLGRSVRVALKCGGMAVLVYYSGGTALAAMGAGATACFWDEAWSAWD